MVTLQQIQSIDPYEFEKLVAELWESKGYDTNVRSKSNDKAIDIDAERGGRTEKIQVKRYTKDNKIGSTDVRKYATIYQQTNANSVALVTSGEVTDPAREVAQDLGVNLIDGKELVQQLESSSVDISDYTDSSSRSERSSAADTNTSQSKNGEVSSAKEIRSEIDPYEFEKLVAELWESNGYDTNVRSKSSDKAIDIDAERAGISEKIQVKRYGQNNKIGSKEVRKYATIYQQTNADNVALVTSGEVTDPARERAQELNVDLYSGKELVQQLESSSVDISDYTDSSSRSGRSSTAGTKASSDTGRSVSSRRSTTDTSNSKRLTGGTETSSSTNSSSSSKRLIGDPSDNYWKWIKWHFYIVIILFLLGVLLGGISPAGANMIANILASVLVIGHIPICYFISKDKSELDKYNDNIRTRHWLTLIVFAYFTGFMYLLFYPLARIIKDTSGSSASADGDGS